MPRIGKGDNLIQKFAVLYIIVWSISPPLEIDMIYRVAALGCAGIWGIMALSRGLYVEKVHVYAVIFAMAVVFISYMETDGFSSALKHIAIYMMVVCFVINAFYENRWQELSGIIPIVLILLIVFNWKTTQALIDDHTIARSLIRDDEEVYQYLRQGIGGYSLIYPQVCISPVIMAWTIKAWKNHKLSFVLGCVWVFTFVECILKAGYSIAIFATIVGVIVLLIYKGRSAISAIILSFIVFGISIALIIYSDAVRGFLLETFDGTAIATKINDLMATSSEGQSEGSIEDRIVRYRASIENIIKYPLIGSLWMNNGGGHSAVMDNLAKYGIWGGGLYIVMLFYVPKQYKKKYVNSKMVRIINAVMVTTFFVGFLDSFSYSFMPMILIILPLFLEDILKWEGINNENSLDSKFNNSGII